MSQGISLPIRVQNGRCAVDVGETQLKKIIALMISDCESDNPFQSLGIDTSIIFSMSEPATLAIVRRRIESVFTSLQANRYARLSSGFPKFEDGEQEGEVICSIQYVNLETTLTEDLVLSGSSPFELYKSSTRGI